MTKTCYIAPGFEFHTEPNNRQLEFSTPSTSIAVHTIQLTAELRELVLSSTDGSDGYIEVTHYTDGVMAWKISGHGWETFVILPPLLATALRRMLEEEN